MIAACEQRNPAGVVDDVGKITENFVLIGVVVDRIAAAGGIFNADAIVQMTRRYVIAEPPDHATALETLHDRVETAHVDGSFVAGEDSAVFCVNIDHTGRAKPELCGQSAGHERNVIGEASLEFLAETRDALGYQHVVDAVLQVRVFAADMKLAE